MSLSYVLHDTNGDEIHLNQKYVRYGKRILDASFIATISLKKHKLLFNNFKQNTTLPVMSIPFKKETDARHAMNLCLEFYNIAPSNPFYTVDDKRTDVFLPDAFGDVMHVSTEYVKYRNRVMNANDVRTAQVKGRRVLLNHYKGNLNLPTMCVHFADKSAAENALNTIQSILWNVSLSESEVIADQDLEEKDAGRMERAMEVLDKPVDPAFLMFMTLSMSMLLALSILRFFVGEGGMNDEL